MFIMDALWMNSFDLFEWLLWMYILLFVYILKKKEAKATNLKIKEGIHTTDGDLWQEIILKKIYYELHYILYKC